MPTSSRPSSVRALDNPSWAQEEFGHAKLGDERLRKRLVSMAAQAAARPHGEITATFSGDAPARQAAYKHLEHGKLPHAELVRAASTAAWARADTRTVIVSVDPCTLSLPAATRAKGFGPVGDRQSTTLGAMAINALLLSPQGVPLGLAGQCFWRRSFRRRTKKQDGRPFWRKETRFWAEVGEQVRQGALAASQKHGRSYLPWLQFDAGADAWEVLEWAAWTPDLQVTVRNQNERNTLWPEEAKLRVVLGAQPRRGQYRVRVPGGGKRRARRAHLAVRCCEVVLPLRNRWTDQVQPVALFAVQAKEEGTCPPGEEPLEWVLLTTRPVRGFRGAREVLRAYTLRWRVEEVHRSWKRGGCQVERSGLGFKAFQSWALLLICVAVRAERLKRVSREQPEKPAASEFTEYELRALALLRKKGAPAKDLKLGQAVLWVAELGGYVGKSSGGPPGATTLRRGLERLEPAAELLRLLDAQN